METTYTSNRTLHTLKVSRLEEKVEVSDSMKKILLFLLDKIIKFGDIPNLLKKGGEYDYILPENRPKFSFIELSDKEAFDLHLELLKIKQNLNDLDKFFSEQKKEWRKEFMPKINIAITGKRSCPPIMEVINTLGLEETEIRIDRVLANLDALMFPEGLGGVKVETI